MVLAGVTFSLQLLGAAITLVLYVCDKSAFVMDTGPDWNYRLRDSNVTDRDDAWNAMVGDDPNTYWAKTLPDQAERSINFDGQELEVYYAGSCFTADNLKAMQKFEDELLNRAKPHVCDLERYNYNHTFGPNAAMGNASGIEQSAEVSPCRKLTSVQRLFDGTFENAVDKNGAVIRDADNQKTFRADPAFSRIKSILEAAFISDGANEQNKGGSDIKVLLQYAVGSKHYQLHNIDLSGHCRSKLHSGAPVKSFHNIQERLGEQRDQMMKHHVEDFKGYLEDNDSVGGLDMVFTSAGLEREAHAEARSFSFYLCIGGLGLTYLSLILYVKSVFLPTMLVISCGGTLFWTNIVYRYVFNFQWYGLPMQLSPFIVVYYSVVQFMMLYTEFSTLPADDSGSRLGTAVRRGNLSIGVCCVLCMISFFSHCFSRLQVVQSTGLFFGILCFVNMMTYLVYYPALIALWEKKVLRYEKFMQRKGDYNHSASAKVFRAALGHKMWRWFVLSGILILLSTMIIFTVRQTGRQKKQPKTWRETNNYGEVEIRSRSSFDHSSSGHQTQINIIWGLHNLDQEECHPSDHTCLGDPTYDNLFDLSSTTAQEKLIEFCDKLKNLDGSLVTKLQIQRKKTGPIVPGRAQSERPTEVKCFIMSEEEYYKKHATATYVESGADVTQDVTLPFTYNKMSHLMKGNPSFYQPGVYTSCAYFYPFANSANEQSCDTCDSYYRHYEVSALNWLTNGGDVMAPTTDLETYVGLFGGSADATLERTTTGKMRYAGDYGNFIRYAAIQVNLTMSSDDAEYEEAKSVFSQWDNYVADAVSQMPLPLKKAFQTAPKDKAWAWMEIQEVLVAQAVQGCAIGIALYFVILSVYMNNFAVGIVSTMMVAAVPTMVVGIYTFCGWKIGYYESINVMFPVGISIDLISHLAIWYCFNEKENPDEERLDRAKRAFVKLAPTIGTAGCLLFGSSLFLLGSPLNYVFTLGVTFTGACAASCAAALFFVIVMGIAGPEGVDGKIVPRWPPWGDKGQVQPTQEQVNANPLMGSTTGGYKSQPTPPANPLQQQQQQQPPLPPISQKTLAESDSDSDAEPENPRPAPTKGPAPTQDDSASDSDSESNTDEAAPKFV